VEPLKNEKSCSKSLKYIDEFREDGLSVKDSEAQVDFHSFFGVNDIRRFEISFDFKVQKTDLSFVRQKTGNNDGFILIVAGKVINRESSNVDLDIETVVDDSFLLSLFDGEFLGFVEIIKDEDFFIFNGQIILWELKGIPEEFIT